MIISGILRIFGDVDLDLLMESESVSSAEFAATRATLSTVKKIKM